MSARVNTLSDILTETIASALRRDDLVASDETLKHLAFALDSALEDEGYLDRDDETANYPDDDEHAHHIYCVAYDGRTKGLAETREVSLPDWATGGLSVETLYRLARMERERDDLTLAAMRLSMRRQAQRP
jgi:hypothetical protein